MWQSMAPRHTTQPDNPPTLTPGSEAIRDLDRSNVGSNDELVRFARAAGVVQGGSPEMAQSFVQQALAEGWFP